MHHETSPHRRVEVVPYDPRWPQDFERASRLVATALGKNLLAIHHIGSTSIQGLHAKPVFDMLAVVADLSAVDLMTPEMVQLGYQALGAFGIEGRRYFRREDPSGRRTHHVHAFEKGSPHIRRHLAFRDYLRANPDLARQYGELKQRLAEAHPYDIEAYMDGKDAFIKAIEARALHCIDAEEG